MGRTFRGRESQSGRKCERPREEGGRGLASGRGRSRRRRPRLPHPRARLGGAGWGGAGRAPGAGRNAAGRAGAQGGGAGRGAPAPEPRARVLGDVTALESEECRAAGAPSAGPGEVAHFYKCGGFGRRFSKVRKTKGPQQPHLAPLPGGARGGGREWGRKNRPKNSATCRGAAAAGTGPPRPGAPHLIRGTPPSRMSSRSHCTGKTDPEKGGVAIL